tara:strand:- start:35 stop:631 length:597 start_codon:yes stop_codon:yes gene_type:complete
MKEAKNMEWTDGVGKALSTLGSAISKQEKARHDKEEDYFSDPMLYVQDLNTGTSVLLVTDDNEGGKTKGRGYRRCSSVRQRIPNKVPPKLQMSVLLDMVVGMLVPKEEDRMGPLGEAAYNRIASAMVEAQSAENWLKENGKHASRVNEIIEKLQDMTWTERSGDTLLNMRALKMEEAVMSEREILEAVGRPLQKEVTE